MDPYWAEWLHLVVRWTHFTVGVAWIGASFYFNWLNNNIRPQETPKDGVDGEVWAVHGGHFYNVNKYEVAPEKLPKTLHWFKYEAYFTWISGFTLLAIVYYHGAALYLIDPLVAELTPLQATGIGVMTLAVGWVVYDLLCKSPLSRQPVAFAAVGLQYGPVFRSLSRVWGGGEFATPESCAWRRPVASLASLLHCIGSPLALLLRSCAGPRGEGVGARSAPL